MHSERKCNNCGATKPLFLFYRDKNRTLGRDYKCKICRQELWRGADRSRRMADRKRWLMKNEDHLGRDIIRRLTRVKWGPAKLQSCVYCFQSAHQWHHNENYHIDEIIPVCRSCHLEKEHKATSEPSR